VQYLQTAFGTSAKKTSSCSKCSQTFNLLPCGVSEGVDVSTVPELSEIFADMLTSLTDTIKDIEYMYKLETIIIWKYFQEQTICTVLFSQCKYKKFRQRNQKSYTQYKAVVLKYSSLTEIFPTGLRSKYNPKNLSQQSLKNCLRIYPSNT
jgi:hypothetical protein